MNLTTNFAMVFPGQGSQKTAMLADFGDVETVRNTFREASEILSYDTWELAQNGPQEKLNLTEITQPILLTASISLWRLWQDSRGATPSFLAGHSLGEWSALVASEVIEFEDAVGLVRSRGQYMQQAVAPGKGLMAAIIGLSDTSVEDICAEISNAEEVSPVNYNSPAQVVIAGHAAAVKKAIAACKQAGAKRAVELPVSAPFHTTLMKPAAERLATEIMTTCFSTPKIPIIHNVNAAVETVPEKIQQLMIEQIYCPVKWVSCVENMVSRGVEHIVECGPGKVLCGLNRRIDKTLSSHTTESSDVFASCLNAIK